MPSYAEVYRVGSLVETKAGEFFRAAEELDQAVQHDPESAIVRYTYALFLMREMDDAGAALEHLDVALSIRADEPALSGARALALTRLGRYEEAAGTYEHLLESVGKRARRWRVATRDQAAECYRRWAEVDIANRDFDEFRQHIDRALAVLADAVDADDYDDGTGYRIGCVLEEALVGAVRQRAEEYARGVVGTAEQLALRLPRRHITVKSLDRLRALLARAPELFERVEEMCGNVPRRAGGGRNNDEGGRGEEGEGGRELRVGTVARIVRAKKFGFVTTADGRDWFFHRNEFMEGQQWEWIEVGMSVSFYVGENNMGPCATELRVIDAGTISDRQSRE